MGDIIHTLPALTDAVKHYPDLQADWVAEESFIEIPSWHPYVKRVIPVAWRRFRRQPLEMLKNGELRQFLSLLRQESYDFIIDAQGLMKSAILVRLAKGLRCGLDAKSVWEPLASLAYSRRVAVEPKQHAILRMRQLFSKILSYPLTGEDIDYGLCLSDSSLVKTKSILFIHNTTWETKCWPEKYWQDLAKMAVSQGYEVLLPWGNELEKARAQRIAADLSAIKVLPRMNLTQLAHLLLSVTAAVSVDTGLGHLAAALNVPTVSIYGPTDPNSVGTKGKNQKHVSVNFSCAPCWKQKCGYNLPSIEKPACYTSISPEYVWQQVLWVIENA